MSYGPNDGNHFDDDFMYIKDTYTKNKKNISIPIPPDIKHLLPKSGYILGKSYSISALSLKFFIIMKKIYGKKLVLSTYAECTSQPLILAAHPFVNANLSRTLSAIPLKKVSSIL
jgi:hypothetical protein